jgi:RHS repeat-associated protein
MQDHLGSTSATASDAGVGTSTITYFPFGSVRATTGTVPTDVKFTGQRLDQTGLYYYGARYYDANIGRFLSPDTIVPNPANPQSLNRYSYCLNNPLRYIDPSGHESLDDYRNILYTFGVDTYSDVIVMGGSGQPRSEIVDLVRGYQKNGILNPNDHVTILEDKWPEFPFGFDVSTRLEQLYAELAKGHNNVMLLGFSEGAATVGAFLWQLANNPGGTAANMGSTSITEIRAAVLFECPNSLVARNWGDQDIKGLFPGLTGLPDALSKARFDIHLADVWNTNSIVHGPPVRGWEGLSHSYASNPGLRGNTFFGILIGLLDTNSEHGNVLRNQYALNVMHDTFYPG